MKGKHGAAAAGRAEMGALAARAERAERRAADAERARQDAQAELQARTAYYESALAAVSAERDAAASPALVHAERTIAELRASRDSLEQDLVRLQKRWDRLLRRQMEGLVADGMTRHEAFESLINAVAVDDERRARVQSPRVAGTPTPAAHAAIARARGDYRRAMTAEELADLRTLEMLAVARGRWLGAAKASQPLLLAALGLEAAS